MAKFYFHIFGDLATRDVVGVELTDILAAHAYAIKSARRLAADAVLNGQLILSHRIEIESAGGQLIDFVTLCDAFDIRYAVDKSGRGRGRFGDGPALSLPTHMRATGKDS